MTVAELKELIKDYPDNTIIADWKKYDNRNTSEICELNYLGVINVETPDNTIKYIIFG